MHHKGKEKGNFFYITEKKGNEISRDASTFWGVGSRVVKIHLISLKNFLQLS
jgi:hypothetical protein